MQNKKLLIVLCIALVVLIALLGVIAVLMLSDDSEPIDMYRQQLDLGNSYLDNKDYDQAIAAFRTAISVDPDSEDAYYQLAILYGDLSYMDDMRAVLLEGIERTSSQRLRELYVRYFGDDAVSAEDDTDTDRDDKKEGHDNESELFISDVMTNIIANYTLKDYSSNYSSASFSSSGQTYEVSFTSFDATFYFFDADGKNSIDQSRGRPYDTVRPNYIMFKDLSILFGGLENGQRITASQIKNLSGVSTLNTLYDSELSNYIRFTYNHTIFEIATDSSDSFGSNSKNRIYSEFGTSADVVDKTFENRVRVISATTGNGVSGAEINVYENGSRQVDSFTTDGSGYADLKLKAGKYTLKITCEDYVSEEFEFEVFSTGMCSAAEFVISPELEEGQIRIVLEWGDYPRDLDSYLVDSTGRVRVSYTNKKWVEDGRVIAELDVDDTSGYGPETITIYDTSIDFTYFVHDYTHSESMFSRNDISVKVYTDNGYESYSLPTSDDTANGWCVFSYIGGNIVMRNNSVAGLNDFRHYN